MRILVCGGRKYNNKQLVNITLDGLQARHRYIHIIEGGATGADTLARNWAKEVGKIIPTYVTYQTFKANWDDLSEPCFAKVRGSKVYNALAGQKRNQQMLDEGKPDLVVAFPGGKGTADMIHRAKAADVKVIEIKGETE